MQLNGYKGNDMSLGGGSSSQQQLDPALRDLFIENYGGAKGAASGLQARQFAEFTPEQNQAARNISQFADPNSEGFQALRSSFSAANRAANYNPMNVNGSTIDPAALAQAAQLNRASIRDVGTQGVTGQQVTQEALGAIAPQARANIRDINAGSFLNKNMEAYMNPFTKAVTEQGLTDLERSRQLEQINTSAKATAARSFGGSRQGVAEAETNRAYGDLAQKFIAGQNAAGFESARTAAEADLAREAKAQELNQLQDAATTKQSLELAGQFGLANQDAALRAELANQGVDLSTGQINTQNEQQVSLANQAARNARASQQASLYQQANLANQGAGLTANQQRITAANQLANAGTQFTNTGVSANQAFADQAALRQGFSQQQLDAIRNLPLEQQQILNQALGINVGGGSGTQASSSSRQGLLGLFGIG